MMSKVVHQHAGEHRAEHHGEHVCEYRGHLLAGSPVVHGEFGQLWGKFSADTFLCQRAW